MTQDLLTLNDLKPGQSATILEILSDEPLAERFWTLGLTPQAQVTLAHQAPFGKDPIAIQVRGSLLALRREQASQIRVRILS
ncbi:MAG: ferrous iron transport protein A [Deltaproteobacteria bacterium]|nr:ferrous iron transport protein A [Deltaproteobacteria bacterium]